MKAGEIRELSDQELSKKEADTREEIFNLKIQLSTQQTKNVARIGKLKKDLARILTTMKQRQLALARK